MTKGQRVEFTTYQTVYGLTVDDSAPTIERTHSGTISSVGKRFAKVRDDATGKIVSVPVWRIASN